MDNSSRCPETREIGRPAATRRETADDDRPGFGAGTQGGKPLARLCCKPEFPQPAHCPLYLTKTQRFGQTSMYFAES